jgi:DNA gyrase subunit A
MGMSVIKPGVDILVLTETGYGKRVNLDEHIRPKHRGGQGVGLISLEGRKTGKVAAVALVEETDEELLLISSSGQVVRTDVKSVNRYSSAARGVIVMRLKEGDTVAGIAVFREGLAAGRSMTDNEGPDPEAAPETGDSPS